MHYANTVAALREIVSGERIVDTVRAYRPYPLHLSYSSYREGIEWLASQYSQLGLETEVVRFPADGLTMYADRHFPLAWDIAEGWLEVMHGSAPPVRLADYATDPYGIVPFSADSNGVRDAVLRPEADIRNSAPLAEPTVALFTRRPTPKDVRSIVEKGCVAFVAAPDVNPSHAASFNSRQWFNDIFGEGQVDRRHVTMPGFSITPRQAGELLRACASGPLPVRFLTRARFYDGEAPMVTARIPGAEESAGEVWLSAHAYEPNATNNCSGVAMCLEAARAITRAVRDGPLPRPRRTIRFLHGLETFGVYAYALRHPDRARNAVCGLSIDGIGAADRNGVRERLSHVRNSILHPSFAHALAHYAIVDCAQRLGVESLFHEGSPANDDILNDPAFGPAWGLLYGKMFETAGFYHANIDTPDELCPRRLAECASMEAAWAWTVARAGTAEARELATMSRNAALSWLALVCGRAIGVLQPSSDAAAQRTERLRSYVDVAVASGEEAIRSVVALADSADRESLLQEVSALADDFRQAAMRQSQAVIESIRPAPGKNASAAQAAGLTRLEAEARNMIARRRFPGHIGLGGLSDEARKKAAALFGHASLEYWSLDGLRFLWLDGRRSVYDAARAAWAAGAVWDAPEKANGWKQYLGSFIDAVRFLSENGLLVLERTPAPPAVRRCDIAASVRAVGIRPGDVVMVHSSLSQFGTVENGADAVIDALMEVVTPGGVLAMPTFTRTSVGESDPPFNPLISSACTGAIPDAFWRRAGVLRSSHPTHSIAAWGDRAEEFLRTKDPADTFDRRGPWGKLLDWNGKILLFGETMGANTYMHALEAWLLNYLNVTYARVGNNGTERETLVTNYPDGCRGAWYGLRRRAEYFRRLQPLGIYRETRIGNGVALAVNVVDLTRELHRLLKEDPSIFLHKSGCHACAERRAHLAMWKVPDTLPS